MKMMKFISSLDDSAPEELYSYSGVYMHGKLQDDIGYDIPILLEGEIQQGIKTCEVQFPDGDTKLALSFIWDTELKVNPWGVRGLIIYANDDEFEYALSCFKNKVENL